MSFRIVECQMDGETVEARRVIAGPAETMQAAESLLARLAASHLESGYNAQGRYWWARDPLRGEIRFSVELSPADETDGV